VNAVAGSGKTATLIQYASRRPKEKVLYLAFNKSVQKEAALKFKADGLDHVDVKTAHSLAYHGTKEAFGGRILLKRGGYQPYDIKQIAKEQLKSAFKKKPSKVAELLFGSHVLKLCSLYCNSSATHVSDVDYLASLTKTEEISYAEKRIDSIVDATRLFVEKMGSGEIESTHDYYLKRYQLSKPNLRYDVIMFDECQDASPAMLDVVLRQSAATKLFVGDEHQQIYNFRHAKNAMRLVDFPSHPMHTSFRFNQSIADLAKDILSTKSTLIPSFDPPDIRGKGFNQAIKTTAILGRTNAVLLSRAIDSMESGSTKLFFEGGFKNYSFENSSSLYDVLNLHLGEKEKIRSKFIKEFKDIEDLEHFARCTDDKPLISFIGVVQKYKGSLFRRMESLKDSIVSSALEADLIFSTVHKAKGLEYDAVILLHDFMGEDYIQERLKDKKNSVTKKDLEAFNEEINLLYVSATRARCVLNIPSSIVPRKWKAKATDQDNINIEYKRIH
jgi:hypothetical protein